MYNKVDDRKFWLWPSEKSFVEFDLPIEAVPKEQAEFGDWRPANKVEVYPSDKQQYPLRQDEATIRTRVDWR